MNIVIIIFLILLIFIYINYKVIFVSKYKIYDEKIPKSFDKYRILHLSDWHCTNYGKNNRKLVSLINNQEVDAIFISGDFVVRQRKEYKPVLNFIKQIDCKKIYYILGNHEIALGKELLRYFIEELRQLGVIVLEDEKTYILKGKDKIALYGLSYNSNDYDTKNIKNKEILERYTNKYEKNLGYLNKEYFNILLTHDPLYFEVYARMGYDLIYAGHLHGGAIRMLGYCLAKLKCGIIISRLGAGLKKRYNSKMIVSRGVGNSTVPIRVFDPPEISITTLYSKK